MNEARSAEPSAFTVGVACFASAAFVLQLTQGVGGLAVVWLANGLLLAFLTLSRRERYPLLLLTGALASLAANLLGGTDFVSALGFTLANMVEVLVALLLLKRTGGMLPDYARPRELARMILIVGGFAPALSATIATPIAVLSLGSSATAVWSSWFTSCALGSMLVVPLVQMLWYIPSTKLKELVARDFLVAMVGTSFATLLIFGAIPFPLAFIPFAAVVFTTIYFGRTGAAFSVPLVGVIASVMTLAGHGPFTLLDGSFERILMLQVYIATLALTAQPIAAILESRGVLNDKLRRAEAKYRLLVNHSSDALLRTDVAGRCDYASPAVSEIIGLAPEDLVDRTLVEMVNQDDRKGVFKAHSNAFANPGLTFTCQYRVFHRDGRELWLESRTRATLDENGRVDGVVSIIRDVTVRMQRELDLRTKMNTDLLTGFSNRRRILEIMNEALPARPFIFALLDLDFFKPVNDTHGHPTGDEVLKAVAKAITGELRSGDLVGRLGGEEFAVLLFNTDIQGATSLAERLREAVSRAEVVLASGEVLRVTVSIGLTPSEGHASPGELLAAADKQLYRAKHAGRNRVMVADGRPNQAAA